METMQQTDRVGLIEAKLSIQECLATWADSLDRSEYEHLNDIWTEDCQFRTFENDLAYQAGKPALSGSDRADSIAQLGGLLSRIGQTHHFIGNIRIELNGSEARAECLVRTYHAPPEPTQGQFWESLARMYVRLERRDRWRIRLQDYVVLIGLGSLDIFRRRKPVLSV